jgi:hypothetical protein
MSKDKIICKDFIKEADCKKKSECEWQENLCKEVKRKNRSIYNPNSYATDWEPTPREVKNSTKKPAQVNKPKKTKVISKPDKSEPKPR